MPEPVIPAEQRTVPHEKCLRLPIANIHEMDTKRDSPEVDAIGQMVKDFRWRRHLIQPEVYLPKFESFCNNHPEFPIGSEKLSAMVSDAFAITDKIYNEIFGKEGCPLPYHDIVHAKITGITATKLFLGALVSNTDIVDTLVSSKQLETAIHTFLITSCLHEFNDWLNLPGVAHSSGAFQAAKKTTCSLLAKRNISSLDVDKIMAVDDYSEDTQASLQAAVQLKPDPNPDPNTEPDSDSDSKPKKNFLSCGGEQTNPPIFDNLLLLHIAQACITTADFLQIANPAYFEDCYVQDNQGEVHKYSYALLTLFWEMAMYKPKGIDGAQWRNPDGVTVDIDRLNVNSYYIENIAMPRIRIGIHYLQDFDPEEYDRAMSAITQARLGVFLPSSPAQP